MSRFQRLCFVILFSCAALSVAAEEPLHRQIDSLIDADAVGPVADRCDDATYLRRVTLALAGRIPTRGEVDAFLKDAASDKRQRRIDELLQSDDFPRHMAVTFELMLMERRSGTHVKTAEFRGYLEEAFRAKKSWLEIACEVLGADGTAERHRAAAAFLLQRDVEPHLLTRDTGRIFFGMDLQCAQCHDHPLIDDYRQDDYYGLNAFFLRSALFQPDKKKPALISETAAGEATFKSVFTDREGDMRPRIPGGQELSGVKYKPHERYKVFPARNVRAVPMESRLSRLAQTLQETPSAAFDRNMANRLWAHMFGRGLVHPVDLHHSSNPPTHPAVLDLLATEFRRQNHNVAGLLREIAMTRTWQRDFRLPPVSASAETAANRVSLTTDQANTHFEQADARDTRYAELLEQVDKAVADARPVFAAETAAVKTVEEAMKPRDAARTKFEAARAQADKVEQVVQALQETSQHVAASVALLQDDALRDLQTSLEAQTEERVAALPKLQSAAAAEQQKLADAEARLQEVVSTADPAIAATVPIDQQIRQLRRAAYEQRLQAQQLRTIAEAELAQAECWQKSTQHRHWQQKARDLNVQITAESESAARLQQEMPAAKQRQQTAAAAQQQMQQDMARLHTKVEQQQAVAQALTQQRHAMADALASVSQLARALPELTESGAVINVLQQNIETTAQSVQRQQQSVRMLQSELRAARSAGATADAKLQDTRQQLAELETRLQQHIQILADLRQQFDTAQQEQTTRAAELSETALDRFAAARLTALTPEQLAWSVLMATGQIDRQQAAAAEKLNKEKPLSEEQQQDPEALRQRDKEIERAARQTLTASVNKFVGLYGGVAGQPQDQFFATVDQSLFLANGGEIRSWLVPAKGTLTDRVNRLEDPALAAAELYLSILSRPPSPAEIAEVTTYLQQTDGTRAEAVREVAWALLTSAEFRFQH